MYRHVAERLKQWAEPHRGEDGYSLVGAVVGATYPEQLAELREVLAGILFLVPGYRHPGRHRPRYRRRLRRRWLGRDHQ